MFGRDEEAMPIVQRIRAEFGCAGLLVFIVPTREVPLRARIASELTIEMMQQMPDILRRIADSLEAHVTQLLAGPPPGTKLS